MATGIHIMSTYTVRDLRRLWKPQKERLLAQNAEHPTHIRFHRACSWIARVEQIEAGGDDELALILRWIAFNALYGKWDEQEREPFRDSVCWREFVTRLLQLDLKTGYIAMVLRENKPLVMSIFEDQYLSRFFWEEPGEVRARKSKRIKFDAQTWYLEGRWTVIVDRLLERIYLLRSQLVHGAATYNGALNRTAVRRCQLMLGHLLTTFMLVWIDHGAEEDWGLMCYPPMRKLIDSSIH